MGKKHLNDVHGKCDKPCPVCGKKFRSIRKVEIHLTLHVSHIKPYSCSECGQKGFLAGRLRTKCKIAHQGEFKVQIDQDQLQSQKEWVQSQIRLYKELDNLNEH